VVVVLSRLLTPAEVGIFSITATLITLAAVFREFGVSSYIRQEKELTQAKARSALGVIIASGWTMAGALLLISGPVAAFYKQSAIESVMHVLASSFLVIPFVSYLNALMSRQMLAGKQAVVGVISALAYGATCIGLALNGFSYMALAWANLVNVVVQLAVLFFMKTAGTSLLPSFKGWWPIFKFGSGTAFSGLATLANDAMPELVLGKIMGPYQVGIYSRANGLVGMFQQLIGPTVNYTALPVIAKGHHANEALAPIFAKATSYLTGLAWPVFAVIAVFSEEIIGVLYGPQWLPAAPLVIVLCLLFSLRIGYSLCHPGLIAIGKPHLFSIVALTTLLCRCTLVYTFGAADLTAFAMAILLADVITLPLTAYLMSEYLKYTIIQSLIAQFKSFGVAACCLLLAIGLKYTVLVNLSSILQLIIIGISETITWTLALYFFKHPIFFEIRKIFTMKYTH